MKKLPALILDNGDVIVNSYVIVEYLDELAGGGKLIPASGPTRWRVKSNHSILQGMLNSTLLALREDGAAGAAALAGVGRRSLESRVARHGRFESEARHPVAGRSISCRSGSPACSAMPISASPDCGWRKAYPKLDAFHERCCSRPSVRMSVPPPAKGGIVMAACTLAVGDIAIHRIIEQETTFLPALDVAAWADAGSAWRESRRGCAAGRRARRDDVLILCFQSYVVKTPHHTILVDSCIGNDKPRPLRPKWNMKTDDTYMRGAGRCGFSVEDIDFVMCTHLHVDHVGWNTRLEDGRWVPTFPNARYVFGKTEFDYWTEQNAKAPVPPFVDSVLPVVEARRAEIVRNDYEIGDHVRILPTPGHTPGHVAFAFGRGRDDAVFSGDLMHSPLQARYPDLSVKFDVDQAQAARRGAISWNAIATPTRCAAQRIFPRRSAGTRSGAWATDFLRGAAGLGAQLSQTGSACG